jgi:Flp pilus assembly pilin Flp
MAFLKKLFRCQKGAAMVEYSMLVAGVALVSAAGVSVLGHKTNDMIATVAAILPGAHADDNAPIVSGKVIETAPNADGNIALNVGTAATAGSIVANSTTQRLGENLGITDLGTNLVVEAH